MYLGEFYKKTEDELYGSDRIEFSFMTREQLADEIAKAIVTYNKLFPPKKKSGLRKGIDRALRTAIPAVMILGTVGVAGSAILGSYGIGMGTAIKSLSVTAKAGSALATVQKIASGVSAAGMVYGKVTGDTPKDLIKASELIKSENAGEVIKKVAIAELKNQGAEIQKDNKEANDALSELVKKEQSRMSENLKRLAAIKAEETGEALPVKEKTGLAEIVALATPFILLGLSK